MSELHHLDVGESAGLLPPPLDKPLVDLLIAIVVILLAIAAGLKRAPAPAPTIRLGQPQFAPLSPQDEAEAAQLLGSRLAELWTAGGEPTS